MITPVSQEVRAVCAEHDILIAEGVALDLPPDGRLAIEAPASLRPGVYAIDLVGALSYMGGDNTAMRHIGLIGRFCSIASNIQAGHIEHATDFVSTHPLLQGFGASALARDFVARNRAEVDKSARLLGDRIRQRFPRIMIGNDVWIGEGALIRQGVEIGDGAVIAARAVVTADVPPYAIVAGVPARVLRYRFESAIVAELTQLQWWLYGTSALDGADFTDIDLAIWRIGDNIASGRAEPYRSTILSITAEDVEIVQRPD